MHHSHCLVLEIDCRGSQCLVLKIPHNGTLSVYFQDRDELKDVDPLRTFDVVILGPTPPSSDSC